MEPYITFKQVTELKEVLYALDLSDGTVLSIHSVPSERDTAVYIACETDPSRNGIALVNKEGDYATFAMSKKTYALFKPSPTQTVTSVKLRQTDTPKVETVDVDAEEKLHREVERARVLYDHAALIFHINILLKEAIHTNAVQQEGMTRIAKLRISFRADEEEAVMKYYKQFAERPFHVVVEFDYLLLHWRDAR